MEKLSKGPKGKGLIISLIVFLSIGLTALFVQQSGKNRVIESEWYEVDTFEAKKLTSRENKKLTMPIGPLAGMWGGDFNGYLIKLDFDKTPGEISVYRENEEFDPFRSIQASFKRQGRVISTGDVSCLKVISRRETSFIRTGCPIIQSNSTYELIVNNRNSITFVGGSGKINMTRI